MSKEHDPIALFQSWFDDARDKEPELPEAMALATADASGAPSVRMVLLKAVDDRGFVFYTNLGSQKGRELKENPRAQLCFHWKSLEKQVRISGSVAQVSDEEADAYYASRDRGSRIGAYASRQSEPMEGRFTLEKRVAQYGTRFAVGAIPRPEWWSGFRVAPERLEFWEGMPFRLHRRFVFTRDEEGAWVKQWLFP